MTFYVRPVFDADAGVYYSESDIVGLHVEAGSIHEFNEIVRSIVHEIVLENHVKPARERSGEPSETVASILLEPVAALDRVA